MTRRVKLGTTPSVSVVVASTAELSALELWLFGVEQQCSANNVQLVVIRGAEDGLAELLEKFPSVVFAAADDSTGNHVLRSVGVSLASGDIIAITDDAHAPPPDWVVTLTRRRLS